jgi:hypothetical protein
MSAMVTAIAVWLLWTWPALAAFEAIQASSPFTAFDPLRPALHYWHASPARLTDGDPRIHLAGARPYGLNELGTVSADITLRPGPFGLGVSCSALGNSSYYGELLLVSGLAWQPSRHMAVGVTVEYGRVQPGRRFAPLQDLAAGVGLRTRLGRRFSFDVGASRLGSQAPDRERLFTPRLSAGVALDYSDQLSLRLGALSSSQWALGETIRLGPHAVLAADLLTSPLRLCLGFLLNAGRFGFDFLYRDHPELGGDLSVGLLIRT